MRFVKQSGGTDCFPACIASLLGKPLEEVPHFLANADGDNFAAVEACKAWLAAHGYVSRPLTWDAITPEQHRALSGTVAIMSGPSGKDPRYPHGVLGTFDGKGGMRLVHDPASGDKGLAGLPYAALLIEPAGSRLKRAWIAVTRFLR